LVTTALVVAVPHSARPVAASDKYLADLGVAGVAVVEADDDLSDDDDGGDGVGEAPVQAPFTIAGKPAAEASVRGSKGAGATMGRGGSGAMQAASALIAALRGAQEPHVPPTMSSATPASPLVAPASGGLAGVIVRGLSSNALARSIVRTGAGGGRAAPSGSRSRLAAAPGGGDAIPWSPPLSPSVPEGDEAAGDASYAVDGLPPHGVQPAPTAAAAATPARVLTTRLTRGNSMRTPPVHAGSGGGPARVMEPLREVGTRARRGAPLSPLPQTTLSHTTSPPPAALPPLRGRSFRMPPPPPTMPAPHAVPPTSDDDAPPIDDAIGDLLLSPTSAPAQAVSLRAAPAEHAIAIRAAAAAVVGNAGSGQEVAAAAAAAAAEASTRRLMTASGMLARYLRGTGGAQAPATTPAVILPASRTPATDAGVPARGVARHRTIRVLDAGSGGGEGDAGPSTSPEQSVRYMRYAHAAGAAPVAAVIDSGAGAAPPDHWAATIADDVFSEDL